MWLMNTERHDVGGSVTTVRGYALFFFFFVVREVLLDITVCRWLGLFSSLSGLDLKLSTRL